MPQPRQCVLYLSDGRTKVIEGERDEIRHEVQAALQGWMEQGARRSYTWPMLIFSTDSEDCYINAMQVVEVEGEVSA